MRKFGLNSAITIVSLLILASPLVLTVLRIVNDPKVPFLLSEGGAEWIQIKRPFNIQSWRGDEGITFRRRIVTEKALPEAVLTVRALRTAQVYLDGRLILPFNSIEDWKSPRSVDLKEHLTPGPHELRIIVLNENGPAVLLAHSNTLEIDTGKEWEASFDGVAWGPVKQVNESRPLELTEKFPSTFAAFYSLVPFYLPLFLICFLVFLFPNALSGRYPRAGSIMNNPQVFRLVVLGAWLLLAANNITKIPLVIGFDTPAHYEYISYIAEKGRLPLATEGWQMFQSPLYYLVSALFQKCLTIFLSAEKAQVLLRIIPLICGMMQAELAYRAVKYASPERNDLQVMGMLIGGFLPMNLYLSQVVGNEPLAGVLCSASIVMTLGTMNSDTRPVAVRRVVPVGIVLGLALLTKVTALLLIPPVVLALLHAMLRKEEPMKRIAGTLLALLCIIILISGWYYLRNWLELGKPFLGGWDVSRQIIWWQEPGYRTLHDFVYFGTSLVHPIYAAVNGFWDSIYSTFWLDGFIGAVAYDFRPRWNYDFMLSGTLLSLLPAAGIIIGFFKTAGRPRSASAGWIFSAYCIAVYFAALVYLYVTLPIYSTAKATYTVGLIPCYAILCVLGLDLVSKNRYTGAAIKALFICWALTAYCSYFVL